jgi:hypothetical protein
MTIESSPRASPPYVVSLALLALLLGCAAPAPEPLRPLVSIEVLGDAPPRFGELREARISVLNTTVEPILLRSIVLEGQVPAFWELQASVKGRLRYSESNKQYVLGTVYPDLTPRVVADDTLLLPAERTVFENVPVRCRFEKQRLKLYYQSVPFPLLLECAYFPEYDPKRSQEIRFRKQPFSKLKVYGAAEPGTPGRFVVIPRVQDFGAPVVYSQEIELRLGEGTSRAELLARLGASPVSQATFWHAAGLWIIDDPEAGATFAVAEAAAASASEPRTVERRALPRSALEVFDLIESYPASIEWPSGEEGLLASKDEALEVLDAAARSGWKLSLATREGEGGAPVSRIKAAAPPGEEAASEEAAP